jgi:hypothetical protein
MTNAASSLLVSLAVIALAVFYVTPNRHLNTGHWGAALMLVAFVNGSLSDASCSGTWFWLPLLGGAGLFAHWVYRRLAGSSSPSNSLSQLSESDTDHGK